MHRSVVVDEEQGATANRRTEDDDGYRGEKERTQSCPAIIRDNNGTGTGLCGWKSPFTSPRGIARVIESNAASRAEARALRRLMAVFATARFRSFTSRRVEKEKLSPRLRWL